ncbi:hypothetical protein DCAR_0415307 [Daucus carota subsp. sativus]|uniref:Uncharacterized protein n=1 Tax=Daucus carota subsp. sativus TaxID=79200 RepID=A0A165AA73_DAUCS|nr:hypothetical protein DCAR_0415307 [Daucus carota subsp. sativus]
MEFIWEIPDKGYYKINVHVEIVHDPLNNTTRMSVAAIIRDDKGVKVWGSMGPVSGLTEEQALMAGIQAACIEALKKDWNLIHIETSNLNVFDTLSVQEHIVLREDQVEAYGLFNTVHGNNFREGKNRRVAWIPDHMNTTAQYMAIYGLSHCSSFSECPGLFGDLKFHLDRDMGLVLPGPVGDLPANFGDGEVIDGPPPPPAVSRKRKRYDAHYDHMELDVNEAEILLSLSDWMNHPDDLSPRAAPSPPAEAPLPLPISKGKEKLYENFPSADGGWTILGSSEEQNQLKFLRHLQASVEHEGPPKSMVYTGETSRLRRAASL